MACNSHTNPFCACLLLSRDSLIKKLQSGVTKLSDQIWGEVDGAIHRTPESHLTTDFGKLLMAIDDKYFGDYKQVSSPTVSYLETLSTDSDADLDDVVAAPTASYSPFEAAAPSVDEFGLSADEVALMAEFMQAASAQ